MPSLTLLVDLFNHLKGYRTYLSAAASILTSLATIAGILSPTAGATLSIALLGVAQVFQRLATADGALTLATLVQSASDLKASIEPLVAQKSDPTKTVPAAPAPTAAPTAVAT